MIARLATALTLTCALCAPARAQGSNCAPRETVLHRLADRYGETRRSVGLGADNTVIEVFAADSGSWTITVTTAQGVTCLIASGQAFEALADTLPEPGDDA